VLVFVTLLLCSAGIVSYSTALRLAGNKHTQFRMVLYIPTLFVYHEKLVRCCERKESLMRNWFGVVKEKSRS